MKITTATVCSALALLTAVVLTTPPATAQNVIQTDIEVQPLLYVKEGATRGCGVRLFGGGDIRPGGGSAEWFDVSFNLHDISGTVKAVSYDVAAAPASKIKRTNAAVQNAWIKVDGSDATKPATGIVRGEDKGSILYVVTMDQVLNLFKGILDGRSFMVAIRRSGQGRERIYAGVPKLTEPDAKQLLSCLTDLSR